MRSYKSMGEPLVFRQEPPQPNKGCIRSRRTDSAASDSCSDLPPTLSNEASSPRTERRRRRRRKRSGGVGEESCRQSRTSTVEDGLEEALLRHKLGLRSRCQRVREGTDGTRSGVLLNTVYAELSVSEGRPVQTRPGLDIFKVPPGQERGVRVVLTRGVAGVGKTFLVQKFTLDWAERRETPGVRLLVLLSFRELNSVRHQQHSLLTLLHAFHPALQKVPAEQLAGSEVLLIFDGLDESRLALDFNTREVVCNVAQKSTVSVVLTNLLQGNLLPLATVWITARPPARIPPELVDRVTDVEGFDGAQRDEYLRRRLSQRSGSAIAHIHAFRSLRCMCHIPVFCWIAATVLDQMLPTDSLPTTIAHIYSHFLLVQTMRKKLKYDEGREASPQELTEDDRQVLLKLGRLASEHLHKGVITFYQDELELCGLDATQALVQSGVCTEIFTEISQRTAFGFVHLSVQEFLAAVYSFHSRSHKDNKTFLGKSWSSWICPALCRKPTDTRTNTRHKCSWCLLDWTEASAGRPQNVSRGWFHSGIESVTERRRPSNRLLLCAGLAGKSGFDTDAYLCRR